MTTNTEMQILDTLWKAEEALTGREIIEQCGDRSWEPSYIYICLASLMKKELIRIDSFKKNAKNYSRAFRTTLTKEEYFISMIMRNEKLDKQELMRKMIEEETDPEMINDWISAINKRKADLE